MTRPCIPSEPWRWRRDSRLLVLAWAMFGCGASATTHKAPVREMEAPPPPPPPPGAATTAPGSCAAVHEPGGYCFASVDAACRALACSDKGCSIGYSLPPVVSCAAPGEAAVPDAN